MDCISLATLQEIPGVQRNRLDEPECKSLLRQARLVAHLYHVPSAYIVLLGTDLNVSRHISAGRDCWINLQSYPLERILAKPRVWPDPSGASIPGFVPGDLQFAAFSPLRSSSGLDLGLLAIADVSPHAGFSPQDLTVLAELADVLSGKMELRLMAEQAREAESFLREAERRFRNIANYAPVMIAYSGIDGGVLFVNKAWLDFTGRSFEDELGAGYAETFHADYRDLVINSYWEHFRLRRPRTIRFPMRHHSGEYRWMEARGVPRFRDDGTFAGYIGCFIDLGKWHSNKEEI